ncbi:unnamed protein product, partial [Mesorhabditis belari]|uniref:C-type lectin domain-containing protein n=1 Tax=Mesorhabditis belari TaxID=2138241 RepID=A0AAF3J4U3_9BILA
MDQFKSPNDREEILSRDRRTLKSCRRNLNQTQQELVEARGKICGLEKEIQCEQKERTDEFTEINSKITQSDDRSTKIDADLKAEIDSKVAEISRAISARMAEIETDLIGKIAETKRKNDDLEAQLNRTRTFLDLDGWSYLAKTASWYKVIDQKMTFDEAVAYCARRKSHLVSIHSQEENNFVQELAENVYSGLNGGWGFSIGLKRNPNKGNAFEWTDGSSVDFTNWYPRQDSNTHALLWSDLGKWETYLPTRPCRFICKTSSQL